MLGNGYHEGFWGLPKNKKKAFKLWKQAAALGSCNAHNVLAGSVYHNEGNMNDVGKGIYHRALAAMGGHETARHNLGSLELVDGNIARGMKHLMISAKSGCDTSLDNIGQGYRAGFVTKYDYAATLRAYKDSLDGMKSAQRTIVASRDKER